LLLAAVLPVAVLKNGIRIVSLTLLAMYVDPGFLTGQLHHEGGIAFFGLALLMLLPLLAVLRRFDGPMTTAQSTGN
jgi:exosortase/archaeosortase family protein